MSTSKSTTRLYSVLKFISPFLRDILEKDQVTLHVVFKTLAYGQAGIAFAFVLSNLEKPNLVIAGFALLFPVFFVFGIFLVLWRVRIKTKTYFLPWHFTSWRALVVI